MAETSFPNSSANYLKERVMKIFEDITRDCEDEELRSMFYTIGRSYDSLNDQAVHWFNFMADLGNTDQAREMFKPLSHLGILSEVAVFTLVIFLYSGWHKTESALKVYHQMVASGVNPVSRTYSQLIFVLATDFSKEKYLRLAKKYFLETLDKGMKLDRTAFWKIIMAIAYQEPLEKFKEFIQQIKAKGLVLHDYGFYYKEAYLVEARQVQKMQAHLIYSHTIDKDVRFYFYLKTATAEHFHKLGCKMYTALINDRNLDEATEFNNEVKETRSEPIVLIHTSAIKANLKFGKTTSFGGIPLAMLADGVAPNSYTNAVLIKGLAADPNYFGDAKKYLIEMMDKGKRPNVAIFTAVIEGFAKQEDKAAEEEGKAFVQVMMDKGFVPSAMAMMNVLKGRPTPLIRSVMSIVLSTLKQ